LNMLMSYELNSTTKKQIETFNGKDYLYCCLSLCAKFVDKFPLKLVLLVNFYNCSVMPIISQILNVFQLIIILFICAPISQHNESLECYPLLITNLHPKILSK